MIFIYKYYNGKNVDKLEYVYRRVVKMMYE